MMTKCVVGPLKGSPTHPFAIPTHLPAPSSLPPPAQVQQPAPFFKQQSSHTPLSGPSPLLAAAKGIQTGETGL